MRKGIRGQYIIAHDGERHNLLENGHIIIEDGIITHVGSDYTGNVDEWIDAGGMMVMPGLVNIHAHPISTPLMRSMREERTGPPQYAGLWLTWALYDEVTEEEESVISEYAVWELLRKGSTTAVLVSLAYPDVLVPTIERTGIRAYVAPGYREASWTADEAGRRHYRWNVEQGERRLQQTLDFIAEHDGGADGRLRVLLGPEQVETCSVEMLERTAELAEDLDVGMTTHAAQHVAEYRHVMNRHGITPIQLLDETGLLNERLIIAHGIYLSHHSALGDDSGGDLEILGSSDATVAHCPWIRMTMGEIFESLPRYEAAGVNVGLGTDLAPQDMLAEMRSALTMAKAAEEGATGYSASSVLDVATTAGARGLRRPDLGRIAPGCAADLVFVDVTNLDLLPVYDPVITLLYSATGSDVDRVMVGGETVVRDGRVLGADEERLAADIQKVCENLWERITHRADGTPLHRLAPRALPRYDE